MTLVVRQFSPATDPGTYRLVVEVDGVEHVFVLTVSDGELTTVSAPDSLHALCNAVGISVNMLLRLPVRFRTLQALDLPLRFETPRALPSLAEEELWRSPPAGPRRSRVRIGAHVSYEGLDSARRFLSKRVDASFFPRAFEYQVVDDAWDDLRRLAHDIDLLEHHATNRREMVVPKRDNIGARVATRLDVLDTLLLTAAVFELGHVAERARIPVSDGIVHSFRFAPSDGELWGANCSYASFSQRVAELTSAPSTSYVLEADVSAFYHRAAPDVAVHALERSGCDRRLLEGVRRLLRSNSTVGLPVGPQFSAFFAEAVLNDVDASLLGAGATFVRFNDDYRFFCASELEAKTREQQFAEALWRAGKLTPQEAKTRPFRVEDYLRRIRPEPTSWLEELEQRLADVDPYADVQHDDLEEPIKLQVDEARALLQKSIAPDAEADARLCRRAFMALPLPEQLELIPQVLEQLARVRLVTQNLSEAVHIGVPRHPDTNAEISIGLLRRLQSVAIAATGTGNDFTRLWLCNAFIAREMPHPPDLLECWRSSPNDLLMLREIIIALRGSLPATPIETDDTWLRRAQIVAGCTLARPRVSSTAERWNVALEDAVSEQRHNESLFVVERNGRTAS